MHKPTPSEWKKDQPQLSSTAQACLIVITILLFISTVHILIEPLRRPLIPHPLICTPINFPAHHGVLSEDHETCTVIFEDLSAGTFHDFLTFIPNH